MANRITSAGSVEFEGRLGKMAAVSVSGDVEDFTWQVQFSHDGRTTWKPYKTSDGTSTFTGSDSKEIRIGAEHNRVEVTSMGTATEVYIEASSE